MHLQAKHLARLSWAASICALPLDQFCLEADQGLTVNDLPAELNRGPEAAMLGGSCMMWTASLSCRKECSSQCLFSTHPLLHVRLHQLQYPAGHLVVILPGNWTAFLTSCGLDPSSP